MEHTRQDRKIEAGDAGRGRAVTLHDEMIRAEVDQPSKQGTGWAEGIGRINSSLVNAHIFTYFFMERMRFEKTRRSQHEIAPPGRAILPHIPTDSAVRENVSGRRPVPRSRSQNQAGRQE